MSIGNDLLIVAGPSGVGKSYWIKRLLRGDLPGLATSLGQASSAYQPVRTGLLRAGRDAPAHGILQYDLTVLYRLKDEGFEYDPLLQHLLAGHAVTVITLCAPQAVVKRRWLARSQHWYWVNARHHPLRTLWSALTWPWRWLAEKRHPRRLYFQPDALWDLYARWLAFCASAPIHAHWLVDAVASPAEPLPASIEALRTLLRPTP